MAGISEININFWLLLVISLSIDYTWYIYMYTETII